MSDIRIGIVGCGSISGIYFNNLGKYKRTTVVGCADLDLTRAKATAEEHKLEFGGSVDDLLKRDDIDIILNLTIPAAHFGVAKSAIQAGKSVYNEKPLSIERAEGLELLNQAAATGVLVGGAPDTFFGAGLQTCRRLIDSGAIGTPLGAAAFMMGRGPENWHPNPDFFYQRGAGPLFDMGPYYITALVNLLGPIEAVAGMARASFSERVVATGENAGKHIPVETPTHILSSLQFQSGAIGQLSMSFDVWGHHMPFIEIFGSEGSLSVPDPNTFGGPVKLLNKDSKEWVEVPITSRFEENSRGLGVLDLGLAALEKRPARASGELTLHVLDVMHSILESSDAAKTLKVNSTVSRPAPLGEEGPADDLVE